MIPSYTQTIHYNNVWALTSICYVNNKVTDLPKPLNDDAWLAECDALKPSLNPKENDCEAEWLAPAPLALLLTLAVSPPFPEGATLKPPPNPPNLGFTGLGLGPGDLRSWGNNVLGSRSKCSKTGRTGGVITGSNFFSRLRSSGNTKPFAGAGATSFSTEAKHTHA